LQIPGGKGLGHAPGKREAKAVDIPRPKAECHNLAAINVDTSPAKPQIGTSNADLWPQAHERLARFAQLV